MDIATIFGILIAGGLVVSSILMGGSGSWFINYPSLMIVVGGTMGATLMAYPLAEVLSVFGVAKNVLLHRSQSPAKIIPKVVELGIMARKDGFLALEQKLDEINEPFLKKSIGLFVDGADKNFIEEIMETEIEYMEERHRKGAEIFTTMGTFAPAVGMLGTLIGLVQMLMQMEDPSQIGAPMAVSLLTTFYGTLLANLLFLPIANKLRTRSKDEMLSKQMVTEGVTLIQAGVGHRSVEDKLKVFLAPKVRGSV